MKKPIKPSKKPESSGFVDEAVESAAGNYLKFDSPETSFRVISKPIIGWEVWVEDEEGEKKPVRSQIDDEPDAPSDDPMDKPKKFMAMAVIDNADDTVKIAVITQQSVIKPIKALADNPKWGNPFTYDITVSKTGEGMKTKYAVSPSPKKPLSKDDIKVARAKPCNLDALYDGENPWDVDGGEVTEYHFK